MPVWGKLTKQQLAVGQAAKPGTDMPSWRKITLAFIAVAAFSGHAVAQEKSIVVASTTSPRDSGLFGYLLPIFKEKTGTTVQVMAMGTGYALEIGRRGYADVVFVHARPLEEKFVADGFGLKRFAVMYNDFILVGPNSDPAGVKGGKDIVAALASIKNKAASFVSRFVSRGDRSGTHAAELALWKAAGIDIAGADKGPWYREIGHGMGATLKMASAMNAYVLTDRSTWLSFKNRGELGIVIEGDKRLFNQYAVILVSSDRHAHVKQYLGQAFIDWLVSSEGQKAIADYKINGQQLFFPNADDPNG
jgi:tungstate transport system substrate-binding protein